MLPLTGERTVPGVDHERYWFARHVAAYEFAARACAGLRVLDAGAGEGYGSALLGRTARSVVAVEVSPEVVEHARTAYPGLDVRVGDLAALPLADGSMDAVVWLQVIEHVADPAPALAEFARVLAAGGRLWCATPNRLTFPPGNPFHVREYTAAELVAALRPAFRPTSVHGVVHGPRLRAVELLTRRSFPELLLERPPSRWPGWLRRTVAAVRPADFAIGPPSDRSLDLLAGAARA